MKPHVVFDFDGTIANSRVVFIQCFNELAARYRFRTINEDNIASLKDLSMIERLRALKVPLFSLPFLSRKFLRSYHKHLHEIPFMPGMQELLQQLGEEGYEISILSSNSKKTIATFLASHSVTSVSGIYSSQKLFRKEKLLARFIKKKSIHGEDLIYVCDELRDVNACRKAAITAVWVSWGFEQIEVFGKEQLRYVAHTPSQLHQIIRDHYQNRGH
jgi:phosphoglycolate phosphatase